MNRILQIATILLVPIFLFSQEVGKIAGKATDEATGEALAGANILIEGTSLGAATDADGNYVILGVAVGVYTVRAEFIGYRPVRLSNVSVSLRLTTEANFAITSEAVELGVVNVVAERPLIIKNATNTTRIVDRETLNNISLRGVENAIALQTGAVKSGGNIHVRGARSGDIGFYVDGVYTVNPWTLANTSEVSNRAMEEIAFQSGGFDAEFGNSNGGVVNTTTRTGGDQIDIVVEFVQDLGTTTPDTKQDKLYSYGYQLYNVNVGGPLGNRLRFFGSFESRHLNDARPSVAYYPSVRRAILDTAVVGGMTPEEYFEANKDVVFAEYDGGYDERYDTTLAADGSDSLYTFTTGFFPDSSQYRVYSDYRRLYGAKPVGGSDRNNVTANILLDLKPLRIKLGGAFSTLSSRGYTGERVNISQGNYPYTSALLNSVNNPTFESTSMSAYANFTLSLAANMYARLNLSFFDYQSELGDIRHLNNFAAYGDPTVDGNEELRNYGANPLAIPEFVNFRNFGTVFDDYRIRHMSYIGAKGDIVNQAGNHELKVGLEYRAHTLRDYVLLQPMEIAGGFRQAERSNWGKDGLPDTADDLELGDTGFIDVTDVAFLYTLYRNAYTMNTGYTQFGEEVDSYDEATSATPPGEPVILGAYLQDKIELDDMILNVGVRYDRFDFGSEGPATYDDLWFTKDDPNTEDTNEGGRIDRVKSEFETVKPYTYLSPRIGFSFPVTDRTVLHAQYGKFVQHPILNRLYLSDSRLAANLSQGNMTESPNAQLRPERTTQYEVGFAQQLGDFAALDLTGFYKEVRDYTMLRNRQGATLDGAGFSWAQFVNGDYGVVKGLSASMRVRRIRGLMANASYTLQWANGTGSDPSSNFNIAWIGNENYPSSIIPLDYDQRHTGSVMVDYRAESMLGLFDFGVNALYQFGSGSAYTPSINQSAVFGRGWYAPVAAINSGYKPWTSTLDLRVDFQNLFGTPLTAYALVLNAFNTVNVRSVYPGSGEAGTDGWLETPEGKVWLSGNPEGQDFYNDRLRNPGRWESPRMVRAGIVWGI